MATAVHHPIVTHDRMSVLSSEAGEDPIPHLDFIGPNTLPDYLYLSNHSRSNGQDGGQRLPNGKSRFGRPSEATQSGLNLEDLADFAVYAQFDAEQASELLSALHDRYVPEDLDPATLRLRAYELWGLSPDMRPDLEQLNEEYKRSLFQAYQIYQQLLRHNLIGTRNNETAQNQRKISRVFEVLYLIRDMLMAEQRWVAMCDPSIEVLIPDEVKIFKFCPFDYSLNTSFQNLIIYLLQKAYSFGYRRLGEDCYEQVRTPEGYFSHAWKKVCPIKDFVHKMVTKEENYVMWQALTSNGNDEKATRYFVIHDDVEFPRLMVDRHVYSFRNGVLKLGATRNEPNTMTPVMIPPEFHPYKDCPLPQSVVACKYFPMELDAGNYFAVEDWFNIPTPCLQKILDYQELPEDASRLMYVMIGRMCYNVGELDNWQTIPFIRGVAGTGKSTILRLIYSFFNPDQVGVMSSNMEKKFWASSLYDKLIFLCYEARNDFSIPQGEFQSVVSGEEMSVPIKNKVAVSVQWTVPGMMCGNEVPGYMDAAGSISRRMTVFEFLKKVKEVDPMLYKRLIEELPALLFKANMAYIEAVQEHGRKGIHLWWPDYFDKTRQRMDLQTNPLRAFLDATDTLVRNDAYYITLEDFKAAFYSYCDSCNIKGPKWSENYYLPIFEDAGLAPPQKDRRLYDGNVITQTFLCGIGRRDIFEPDGAGVAASASASAAAGPASPTVQNP